MQSSHKRINKIAMMAGGVMASIVAGMGMNAGPQRPPALPQHQMSERMRKKRIHKAVAKVVLRNERQQIINEMTNWQRNQMLRACKGDVSKFSDEQLRHYTKLIHWKEVRRMAGVA